MISIEERVHILEKRITDLEDILTKFSSSVYEAYSSDIPFFYDKIQEINNNITNLYLGVQNINNNLGINKGEGVSIH
jgi:hypothetical protein